MTILVSVYIAGVLMTSMIALVMIYNKLIQYPVYWRIAASAVGWPLFWLALMIAVTREMVSERKARNV
jgi:hypothetical protein